MSIYSKIAELLSEAKKQNIVAAYNITAKSTPPEFKSEIKITLKEENLQATLEDPCELAESQIDNIFLSQPETVLVSSIGLHQQYVRYTILEFIKLLENGDISITDGFGRYGRYGYYVDNFPVECTKEHILANEKLYGFTHIFWFYN